MENEKTNDPFAGMEEVKVEYKTLAWGKVGDWFKGTLTDKSRTVKSKYPPFEDNTVFEFKAHGGSFHDIKQKVVQEEATECKEGEFWSMITGKPALLSQLRNVKIGQIVGFRFSEMKPSKQEGYDDAKIIKVLIGDMDPNYQGETNADQG